ncbi:MAG TPA: hypothetical protein DIV79_01240 [Opitutae bacterium]|nr:hypothetical protein [Opitutaceae bacterium]HCR28627.1 hypothetical protein [Opitutae bacterium]
MLYDRPYMQSDQNHRMRNMVLGVIVFNVVMYAIQLVAGDGYFRTFALTTAEYGGPRIWSFFTYSFLHSPQGIWHIVGNMIGIFFLGRALMPDLGEKRFLQLYFSSVVVGGFLWFIVSFASGSLAVVGASGAVFGLITCFGLMYAEQDIYLMMVLRIKAKILMYVSLGIAAFGLLFIEILNTSNGSPAAHSAHLGGMLGGYLFYKFVYLRNPKGGRNDTFKIPNWFKQKPDKPSSKSYPYKVNIAPPKDTKKEVDRILDKINSKGFGSLTAEEKKILDEAGDLLKKR